MDWVKHKCNNNLKPHDLLMIKPFSKYCDSVMGYFEMRKGSIITSIPSLFHCCQWATYTLKMNDSVRLLQKEPVRTMNFITNIYGIDLFEDSSLSKQALQTSFWSHFLMAIWKTLIPVSLISSSIFLECSDQGSQVPRVQSKLQAW